MNLVQPYYIEPRQSHSHFDLNGWWEYTYADSPIDDIYSLDWKYTTQIPNSIYWSLYQSNVLPHPYEKCNSKLYHWVDEKVWYYRKKFILFKELKQDKAFLCFDGVAYYSKIWLNRKLLGTHEGMFGGPIVEVDDKLNFEGENELIVEIKACNYGMKEDYRRLFEEGKTTAIVPWNIVRDSNTSNGDFIVIGLWQGVRLEFLPNVHISRPYLFTKSIHNNYATINLKLEITTEDFNELNVSQDYGSGHYEYTRAFDHGLTGIKKDKKVIIRVEFFEKGSNRQVYFSQEDVNLLDYGKSDIDPNYYECQFYTKEIVIENPKLWYPVNLGEPNLYDVVITLLSKNAVLDIHKIQFGIRTVELEFGAGEQYRSRWDKFQFVVNGKKFFLKGMNWMPTDFLYKTDKKDYLWLLNAAKDAGIQLLRVWSGGGFYETDDFYNICDQLGIMVWQDSFIANCNTPSWPQDVLQAQLCMNIYRIRNHPSLVVHCGGNEFNPYSFGNAASMFVIERNIQDLDPVRPFKRTTPDMGSAHIYRDMEPTWYRNLYKQLPFVGESGIHSFPNAKSLKQLMSKEEFQKPLANIFSEDFKAEFPELLNHFTEYIPERVPRMLSRASYVSDIKNISIDDIAEATQFSACEYYQIMIEGFRENYPVTCGIMPWVYKRPWTTVGIQLIDGMGEPIAPYYYVKNAYKPTIVMLCLEHLMYAPKEELSLPIKIINESGLAFTGAKVLLQIFDKNLNLAYDWSKSVNIAADEYSMFLAANSFIIPQDYEDTFFIIKVVLIHNDSVISQSVYWPKCLSLMKDEAFKNRYRQNAMPNVFFENGPFIKTQIQNAKKAKLECRISSIGKNGEFYKMDLEIQNVSNVPAFPVVIKVTNLDAVCYLSDNYYFQDPHQKKHITCNVYLKNQNITFLDVEIGSWNSDTITLKGRLV